MIIAIDGPAGSGKSTTAREIARRLDALYIDTGAMYRAVALHFLRSELPISDEAAAEALRSLHVGLEPDSGTSRVLLGKEDVTEKIRREKVSAMASRVSRLPTVRRFLVDQQRRIAAEAERNGRAVVMEGRDIGTVVFPEADFKFFVTADVATRSRRRASELRERGEEVNERTLQSDIAERDRLDATREHSPLKKAHDAVEIDTTDLSFEDQVEFILSAIRGNGA